MEDMQKQTEAIPLEVQESATEDKEKTAFCNKFSTAEELEKAYDNLQREFTKKCQQNSELTRALKAAKSANGPEIDLNEEPEDARPEGRENETPTAFNGAKPTTPLYESEDWDNRVSEFLKIYPSAERYTGAIAKALAKDAELAKREDCLERAYFHALLEADRPLEDIANDESFIEKYVIGNDRIKERIIEEFLRRNMDVQAPRTIAASGRTHVTPPSRPRSIREAGGIVKNMLANRRI